VSSNCNITTSALDWDKVLGKDGEESKVNAKQVHHRDDDSDQEELDDRQKQLQKQVAELELELEL